MKEIRKEGLPDGAADRATGGATDGFTKPVAIAVGAIENVGDIDIDGANKSWIDGMMLGS